MYVYIRESSIYLQMWALGNFEGVLPRLGFAENYPPEAYRECE